MAAGLETQNVYVGALYKLFEKIIYILILS